MKFTRQNTAFTLIELLVVISIIGILATLAVPAVQNALVQGQMTGTLSNARQIHLATQTMSLDTFNAGGEGFTWTSQQDESGNPKQADIGAYFQALIDNNYLSKNDLRKLITAPGKGPGNADPSPANSCFSFFWVTETSPSDQPFVVTKNWKDKALTANQSPMETKDLLFSLKAGAVVSIVDRLTSAARRSSPPNDNGTEYNLSTIN